MIALIEGGETAIAAGRRAVSNAALNLTLKYQLLGAAQ
jgi:hypothetical protein